MRAFLVGIVVTLFGFLGHGQTVTVVDKESQSLLEGVALINADASVYAVTNRKGQADISILKDEEKIVVRSLGYEPIETDYASIEKAGWLLELVSTNLNLEEVVISASRWRQTTANVPSKIISVSPQQISFQSPQTAADLLGMSGKVFVQKSQQGGGSPMIRGFATNRLIYTVDGVRMNTAIFRGGNIQNVINLDPFATESTEVLFGPGSVIYGSDAIGGAMNFRTLTPELSLTDSLEISGKFISRFSSANSERTGHLDLNLGFKKFALTSSFTSWNYDHLRQGRKGPEDYLKSYYVKRIDTLDVVTQQSDGLMQIPSAYSQINFMQKVRYTPTEKLDFQYGFHYSETTPYGRYDRHNRERNGTARYAEWNYGPQVWMMNNLNIYHQGDNAVYDKLTARFAVQRFEESRISRDLNDPIRNDRSEAVDAYSGNLDFIKSVGASNTLFYGFEYVYNDVTSSGIETNIATGESSRGASRYPNANWSSAGIYINDEFRLAEKATLQAGARYNFYMLDADFTQNLDFYPLPEPTVSLQNGALTGSLGLVYRPSDKWVIKANAGTAFRSPNVDDIGKVFDSEPGAVVIPNSNLEAEYAYNLDLGMAKVFGDIMKVDLTGYYTLLENALVRRDFTLNGMDSIFYDGELSQVQALQNAAQARVYGVQAGLEIKLPSGFLFSSDLNYQIGEEELTDGTVSPSRHAAPMFGVSRLGYRAQRIELQFYAQYQEERPFSELPVGEQSKEEIYALDANGNPYAPSWYTLNFKAQYKINDHFSVNGGIENLTDQRYRPYSSGISGAGRNAFFAVRADF